MEAARSDQRREAGLRTQARLLEDALTLISERGEDGVTLRELTDAAGANIAAVSYHFGSLQSLCDAAVEHALERYLAAQQAEMDALAAGSNVEQVAAAFARPIMHALASGGRDLDVIRIVARTGIDPPDTWDRFDASFVRIRRDAAKALKPNVPDVSDRELTFRIRAVIGMLNWLVLAPVGAELRNRSERQIDQRVVPLLAGALRGSTAG